MPGSEPGEGLRPSVGHKQNTRHEVLPKQTQAPNNAESLRDPNTFLGRINGLLDLVTVGKQPVEVPFGDVWDFSRVINSLRDTSKASKVQVYDREISDMKGLLGSVGLDTKLVDGLQDNEVIAVTQLALPRVQVAQAHDSDFRHILEKDRPAARALALQEVERARDTGENERIFSPEEIEERVVTGEFEKKRIEGGAGAVAWVDDLPKEDEVSPQVAIYLRRIKEVADEEHSARGELSRLERFESLLDESLLTGQIEDTDFTKKIREVLGKRTKGLEETVEEESIGLSEREMAKSVLIDAENKKTILKPTEEGIKKLVDIEKSGASDDDLDSAVKEFTKRLDNLADPATDLSPGDYEYVHYFSRAINEALYSKSGLPEKVKVRLKEIVDFKSGAVLKVDRKFRRVWDDLKEPEQDGIAGDIDREGSTLFKQIVGGWGGTVEQAKAKLLAKHTPGENMLREWRVYKSIEGVEKAVGLRQRMDIPVVWEDIPEAINRIYAFIESTDLAAEELSTTINQVITLIQGVPYDKEATRSIRDKIIGNLEAFRAFHILRITLERGDMNPEKLTGVFGDYFEGKEEKTFEDFVNRFGTDNKGREFLIPKVDSEGRLVDKDGKPITDLTKVEFEKINLLDVSFRLYSETLQDDRIRMNMIEAMTKHAIDGDDDFSGPVVNQIMKDAGYDASLMPERWKTGRWVKELNRLRVVLKEEMREAIPKEKRDIFNGKSVDEVWGRLSGVGDGKDFIDLTKEVIHTWYNKHTLQGAFGTVSTDGDVLALMEEFGISGNLNKGKEMFEGKSYLEVRREHLAGKLEEFLKNNGVGINRALPGEEGYKPSAIDFEELRESGYVKSVDFNAYNFAWMTMWSTYDSIRVFSRDTQRKYAKDDIYERVVINDATNLFYGRAIDQGWEWLHKDVENRGRAEGDDMNELFMQKLPGKHHYIFPQNSLMVRWAGYLMTDNQRAYIRERTRQLMIDNDFDNVKYHKAFYEWMEKVAVMDMIQNGQLTLGQSSGEVGSETGELSGIVKNKKLRKFEMIDVFADRTKHLKYMSPEAFQAYLANPDNGLIQDLISKVKNFYSTRDAREFPFAVLAIRAHIEIMTKHMHRLMDAQNFSASSMEQLVDRIELNGDMEKESAVKEKRKWLGFNNLKIGGAWGLPVLYEGKLGEFFGTTPFRRARQWLEARRRQGWDSKFVLFAALLAGFLAGLAEMAKQLPKQLQQR